MEVEKPEAGTKFHKVEPMEIQYLNFKIQTNEPIRAD
jgi:hypothetical protein